MIKVEEKFNRKLLVFDDESGEGQEVEIKGEEI